MLGAPNRHVALAAIESQMAAERGTTGGHHLDALVDFMQHSPLHGLDDVSFTRDRSPTRDA